MTPTVPIVLNGLARTLLMELLPQVKGGYAAQTLQLSGALTMMIAQEFDRAAARLVEENAALEALFTGAAAALADDPARRGELTALAAARQPSLLVSLLQVRNRTLRGALVRLHAHVEGQDTPPARELDARIWAELAASTQRRLLDMAMPS